MTDTDTGEQARIDTIAQAQPPFAQTLGLRILSAHPDRVEAELPVTEALGNRNNTLHGGAFMALADNLGGTATFLNLKTGEGTSTIESKTNFFRSLTEGNAAITATLVHAGRRTIVVQTDIARPDGKLVSRTTQTQAVLA